MHTGNGHHSEIATTDANNAWAEYVNGLVHQSTMDVLHAASDEFIKLIAGVNGDFDKNIDFFDAKIKAAIATCERATAEIRSNIPAMIDEAVARHVAQAMANIRQPADGAPGPAGPPGKLEVVKDHVEGRVYYERDLVVGGDGALYQAVRDTAATPPHTDWHCITRSGRDGRDALNFRIEGTYDPASKYRRLSIVTLNGSSFVARHDDPGHALATDGNCSLQPANAANKVPRANGASAVHSRLRRGSLVPKSTPSTTSIYATPTARATPFRFVQRSRNSFRRQARERYNPTLSSRRLEAHKRTNLSSRIRGALLPVRHQRLEIRP